LQQLNWPQHLIFNLFFILLAAIAIKMYKKQKKETEERIIVFT